MANENRTLEILITAKNNAQKQLGEIEGKLKSMAPTFKKMALIGTAATGAITAGLGVAVKQAGEAEGALAKFETVFGDNTEAMTIFIDKLRKEMPTARTDIIKLASGLQDLLIPMGIGREEATGLTQGFLDLSNKVAAFNDVNPERVLEAMRSGLVGSSEPLRAFGIDARVGALEATAMSEGLLKAGQKLADLDPQARAAVTAQALFIQATKQSSDAINGFEENQDSFIRRSQELQASIKDTTETIGKIFLPVVDKVLKAILPVIEKTSKWIQENPKLTAVIISVTLALAALVAILGLIGLALPVVMTGFTLLLGPVGLVILAIGALITVGILLIKNWDKIKSATATAWLAIGNIIADVIDGIKIMFKDTVNWIIEKLNYLINKSNLIQKGLNKVPGVNIPLIGEIPKLANGGIVTKPTIAMIGEDGPEAIVPLNKRNGVGQNINIKVYGDISGQDLIDKVKQGIMGELALNAKLPL